MKKRMLFTLTLLLCILLLLPSCSEKQDPAPTPTAANTSAATTEAPALKEAVGLEYKVNADNKTCVVTGIGECRDTDLLIPSVIDGYEVVEIAGNAFKGNVRLTSVIIPDSVQSIGYGAFAQCKKMTAITVPFVGSDREGSKAIHFGHIFGVPPGGPTIDGIQVVPETLKTVVVTGGTTLFVYAFEECRNITSITLPDSIINIQLHAFDGCSGLVELRLGKNLRKIGMNAFAGCRSLKELYLSDKITSIEAGAFENCRALEKVYYGGTSAQWAALDVKPNTHAVQDSCIYFYSESQPTTSGNFWRYVNEAPTAWANP